MLKTNKSCFFRAPDGLESGRRRIAIDVSEFDGNEVNDANDTT